MSTVLAAIDNSAAARPVVRAAVALAELLDAEVAAVHAREDGDRVARAAADACGVPLRSIPGPVVPTLLDAGSPPEVVAVALGARAAAAGKRPAGHVAIQLALLLPKPLVVVPPLASVPAAFHRVLVPLNGKRTTAMALAQTMALAPGHELEVIALHVHDDASLPLFNDQPHHELEAWTREFLQRHVPNPERVRLEVRVGVPGHHVLQVTRELEADLIALGWSQRLGRGHAAVVREVLERSPVPVLLVPVSSKAASDPPRRRHARASA